MDYDYFLPVVYENYHIVQGEKVVKEVEEIEEKVVKEVEEVEEK